jgi:WD repeat-containing protein 45
MSYDEKHRLIAFPDPKMGLIKLRDIDREKSRKIEAHKHPVQCIGMDYAGRYIASSSTKGTIIRIFRTDTLQCIQELRRGMDNATILSLNFNLNAQLLGCSSDSGTVHVFQIMPY